LRFVRGATNPFLADKQMIERTNKIMNIRMRHIPLALCLAALSGFATARADELKTEAAQSIEAFKRADSGLTNFFSDSAGYAVFPNVGKGGLIVGGAHGKGVVYEKGKTVGQASLSQASVGAQAGGQAFMEVIFFESPTALADFKEGKFEMSADLSAVVAGEGASKSAKYKNGVAVFTMAKKGLMVQASIGGQKFKFQPEPLQPTGRPPEEK
jgi:lipid-binding SYLF domain-containing protein